MANQPKKYKKFVATAATATLVASAIVPVASAASLSDIAGNTHEEAINALVDAKVISGYPDGTFKPNKTLTRSDVVKLLGKYLETEGYAPAADYATNPAFNDLKAGSNQELLKYASIVKEAGVFAGSNGNLLAGDKITRENMAVTLVRMINTLKDVSLEEYVAAQDFKGDVKDLTAAKAEARSAIAVLDFFDITNPAVSNFNPKGDTTRGQFATFLYKTINTDFAGASATTGKVTAINNTTIEVTFGKEIADIKALNFAIEGLTVENAVVKQTDKKTAVITTSAQEAGKEYTVTEGENKIGKFTGVAAVIPTAINVTTASVQGTIGKEVTVKAQVTVPEGQAKAGIPVTFNIVNDNSNLNTKIEDVAYTDENGVASYSYTRYYEHNDNVVAYATQKSSVSSKGTVYWNAKLAVTEITSGNELANNTKKSYKVTGKANAVYQIALKENINVTPDAVKKAVKVISLNGAEVIPAQVNGADPVYAEVRTNDKGEGTFTVYGANGEATPVVYLSTAAKKAYTKYDLQAEAPTVKFAQLDRLALTVAAEGTANSAQFAVNPLGQAYNANSIGGRTYTVTVTDKDGKLAPAGTLAYVTFEKGNISGDVFFSTGNEPFTKVGEKSIKKVVVGQDGKAQFRVAGAGALTFVKPTVFLNTFSEKAGDVIFEDDKLDIHQVAEVTYFKAPVVTNAVLKVEDQYGRTITKLNSGQDAYFTYQSVDQNGFAYRPAGISAPSGTATTTTVWVPVTLADGTIGYKLENITIPGTQTVYEYNLSFDVTSTFGDVIVKDVLGSVLPINQNLGNTKTYTVKSDANGKAIVRVTSPLSDIVSVNVTGSNNILPTAAATVEFVNSTIVPEPGYTGRVDAFDTRNNTLTFAGKAPVALEGANVFYTQNNGTMYLTAENFINILKSANGAVTVTRTVKDGVVTFNLNNVSSVGDAPTDVVEEGKTPDTVAYTGLVISNTESLTLAGITVDTAYELSLTVTGTEATTLTEDVVITFEDNTTTTVSQTFTKNAAGQFVTTVGVIDFDEDVKELAVKDLKVQP